jgi:superfamily I DNA/RNA helicase
MEKGFRKIDIDLANFTYRGNVKKVIELLKHGANPDFDPEENGMTILATLATEASWAGLQTIEYLLEKDQRILTDDLNNMIHVLYSAALSEKTYNVINDFVEQTNRK